MRALVFGFALLLAAPAFAALPPQYYEQARRDAADIVVIEVREVAPPPSTQGFGACTVTGRVIGVLRGATYQQGAEIQIDVPCMHQGARVPIGGVLYKPFEALRQAPYGRAYLNDGALALYQYEMLSEWTEALPTP